ncbi:MAG TPA: hypothetical protein VHL14_01505, partial [Steroidobacteraceae bacterium]|nr:hypothetical protein [Steroidobacteraceae bacterium]
LIVVLCAAYGGYHYWQQHQTAKQLQALTNTNGFVEVPTPDSQDVKIVYVVAAENCPHEEAQRADRLFESLPRENVSVQRTHNVSFSSLKDQSEADRINTIMNGELPIVFVHGRAKANPSLDEVMSEVKSSVHSR